MLYVRMNVVLQYRIYPVWAGGSPPRTPLIWDWFHVEATVLVVVTISSGERSYEVVIGDMLGVRLSP